MARPPRPQLAPFRAANDQERRTGTKLPWQERYELIKANFPASVHLDWAEAFRDIDLFGRVIKDILRIDQVNENRNGPGPRPVLDQGRAVERLRQLRGEDYSYLPFLEAFNALAGFRSIRHLSLKTGLGKHITHDLLLGRKSPDMYTIEQIAVAFGKHPSYFGEYRNEYILGGLRQQLEASPETSVDLYKKMRERNVSNSSRRSKRGREIFVRDSQ